MKKINKNKEIINNIDDRGKTALHSFITDVCETKSTIVTFK